LIAALLFGRGRGGIITAFVIGAGLRTALYFYGYVVAPFGIMLVLNVLVFFALGAVAYLVYTAIRNDGLLRNACIAAAILTAIVAYTYFYNGFQSPMDADGSDWRFLPLYGLTALLLPFLFAATKDIKIDRMIGELSYPIYLVHIAVIDLANHISFSLYGPSAYLAYYERSWFIARYNVRAYVAHYEKSCFILGVSLAAAGILYLLVARPVDVLRQRLRRGTAPRLAIEAIAASKCELGDGRGDGNPVRGGGRIGASAFDPHFDPDFRRLPVRDRGQCITRLKRDGEWSARDA
jgi:peptidoglycan/LPS O-acetylase OafA/YrhL